MPNETDRRTFVEMLEIIKHFNKLYQPVPVQGYDKPWQQEVLAQIEMEVVKNITHMSSYKPDQQRIEPNVEIQKGHFKVGKVENQVGVDARELAQDAASKSTRMHKAKSEVVENAPLNPAQEFNPYLAEAKKKQPKKKGSFF